MTFQPRDYQALFSLLSDPSAFQIPSSTPARPPPHRAFSPNFDVHETPKEYVLEGELPGLSDKSKVSIEFTDPQTLLVHGRIERSSHLGEHGRRGNLNPTVEEVEAEEDAKKGAEKALAKKDTTKYWVSERSIGEFQRSFTFPGAIDLDHVKASLEYGVLSVVVPKKVQTGSRKIEIH